MRRSFISITWTPGVDASDARLLLQTVDDTFTLLKRRLGTPGQFDPLPGLRVFGAWAIPSMPDRAVYRDVAWCVSHSLDDRGVAILASRYLHLIDLEPWQATHPHFDLCLTELPVEDDTSGVEDERRRAVLGISRRGVVSLISTRRFDGLTNLSLRRAALQHSFAHFLGQLFDAPDPRRPMLDWENSRPYCPNECAMRYTPGMSEASRFGERLFMTESIFCEDCQYDLLARLASVYFGLN
jgi:hypothetical protein